MNREIMAQNLVQWQLVETKTTDKKMVKITDNGIVAMDLLTNLAEPLKINEEECPKCESENTETTSHDYSDESIEIRKYCSSCASHYAISYEFYKGAKYLE